MKCLYITPQRLQHCINDNQRLMRVAAVEGRIVVSPLPEVPRGGCLQVQAIMNISAANISAQVFCVHFSFQFLCINTNRIAGSYDAVMSSFSLTSQAAFRVAVPPCVHTEGFHCFINHQHWLLSFWILVTFLDVQYLNVVLYLFGS